MTIYSREDTKKFLRERVARPASAGVILENGQGQLLILKANYKNYWSFPGGWIENDQSPIEAALRELEEETGMSQTEDDLDFAFVVNRKSNIMDSYQFMFKSKLTLSDSPSLKLQASEIDDWKFIDKQDVLRDIDNYQAAVVYWARGDRKGYYEQTMEDL